MMLKKLILIILVSVYSNAITLKAFADDYVSRTQNAVTIDPRYNDTDIKVVDTYYTSSSSPELTKYFKLSIVDAGFVVQLDNNIIYVTNLNDSSISNDTNSLQLGSNSNNKQYIYNLKYITSDDVQTALSSFYGVDIKYLKSYNQIVYSCDEKDKKRINAFLNSIDVPIRSNNIRITVFNSSDDVSTDIGMKINDLSLSLNSNVSNSVNYFDYLFKFDAYISALKDSKKISISQSPSFFLINGNKLSFKSVKNVPYLTQSATIENTGSSTTNAYNYKDVGLQISILPKMSKNSTLLDLDLKIEDLIDLNADKPLTNRIDYQNTIVLNNVPVLLTGLKKSINSHNVISVPLLSDIPFLGNIFKFKSNVDSTSNMSILIEFIPNISNTKE